MTFFLWILTQKCSNNIIKKITLRKRSLHVPNILGGRRGASDPVWQIKAVFFLTASLRTSWQVDNQWDVLWEPLCDLAMFPYCFCEERAGALPAMQGLTDPLLGLLTRVSACLICSINMCSFVWHNFSPWHFVFKLVTNFENYFIKYSSIPIFAAMYAVSVTSPAQLPLLSGCQNSGGGQRQEVRENFGGKVWENHKLQLLRIEDFCTRIIA